MSDGERLQKVLARGGLASRREAEKLITEGRVSVNGEVVRTLGTRVDPTSDRVEVDGRLVEAEERVYFLFHKPRGVVTTLDDPEGRPSIGEYVKDVGARVFPVGRLDFHTSGALLLTNDGALANALLHPTKSVAKTYVAKVRGVVSDEQVQRLREGVELAPVGDEKTTERTRPAEVEVLRSAPSGEGSLNEAGTTWLEFTLREGRNRQIHRMCEAVGLFVMRLARISFAGITHEGLRAGQLRELTAGEASLLRRTYLGVDDVVARRPARDERATKSDPRKPEARRVEHKRSEHRRDEPRRDDRPRSDAKSSAKPVAKSNDKPAVKKSAPVSARKESAMREARKAAAKNRGRT
ncbi:MAG: rRNA pseudouridine synthase [Myxococcales bacterium]|nr:rRNA pseudouridine synthase [Myxococcales bacterium]